MKTMLSIALLAAAALTACSTPAPVRELASQGASMADQAQRETRGFLDRAADAYAKRADTAELRARRNAEDAADADFTNFIAQKAGDEDPTDRIQLIKSIASRSRETRDNVVTKIDQQTQALAVQPLSMTATTKALAEAKKAFVILSQELSPREWTEFGWKYFQQVKDAYKASAATPSP